MSARLLVAVSTVLEAQFVTTVQAATQATVARRCADVADLLAAAAAGIGDSAAVSPDVPHLERDVIDQLRRLGLWVLGVVAPDDEAGERRLRQLGVGQVITTDATAQDIDAAVVRSGADPTAPRRAGSTDGVDLLDAVAGADLDRRLDAALDGDLDALGRRTDAPSGSADKDGPSSQDGLSSQDGPGDRGGATDPQRRGRIIAVWGPTGAPGRTTTAITLAAEFAAAGISTLLIDADTYGASVAQSLGLLDDTPGLAAVARAAEQGTLDAPSLQRRAPEVSANLRVLTGLPRADRWPEVRDGAMEAVLDTARLVAEMIVVDCGFSIEADEELSYDTLAPRRNATTLTTLEHADDLLVVGAADPVGLQRLVRALGDLGHISSPRPSVVVTKVRAAAAGPRPERSIRELLSRFSGIDDLALVPDDRDACDASMLAGRTLVEHAPSSPARIATAQIAWRLAPQRVAPIQGRRRRRD